MNERRKGYSKFHLAVLVALVPVIIAYAYYLTRPREEPVPASTTVVVQAEVLADGSVMIDGKSFSDPESLKTRWAALQAKYPDLSANIKTPRGISSDALGKAIGLFQQAGIYKVTFVTGAPKDKSSQPP